MKTKLKRIGLLAFTGVIYLIAAKPYALAAHAAPARARDYTALEFAYGFPAHIFTIVGVAAWVAVSVLLIQLVNDDRNN